MATIEIETNGPTQHVSVPAPEEGGVVTFLGTNGAGKSECLKAINNLLTGQGKLNPTDGAEKARISGFGLTVTFARSRRCKGELEVRSFDDSLFNISDVIDPKIADPAAADAKRIKALVQIAGATADPALFADLVGGIDVLKSLVHQDDLEAGDLPTLAAKVKRRLESKSRDEESQAERFRSDARAFRAQAEGVDLEAEHDAGKLQADLEAAIGARSALDEQVKAAAKAHKAAGDAQKKLVEQQARYAGPTVEEAERAVVESERDVARTTEANQRTLKESSSALDAARAALAKAEALHDKHVSECNAEKERADAALTAAKAQRDASDAYRDLRKSAIQAIEEANKVSAPDASALDAAEQSVAKARQALEAGVLIRQARKAIEDAKGAQKEAGEHSDRAEAFREAAQATEQVLSDAVGRVCKVLRVEGGRLVTCTKRKPSTMFADLSDGERGIVALGILAEALAKDGRGSLGAAVVDQIVWDGIAPENRAKIRDEALRHRVLIYTAESTDGPLRAEVLAN